MLWSRVVDSVVATHESALEPSTNYLAKIEAEFDAFMASSEDINLPSPKDTQKLVSVCQGNAQVVLEESPKNQLVVWEADVEDPKPLRSATMTFAPGASSRAADDNMSLLDDDLLDA